MASNVIGQQNGAGEFVFTNLNNGYGGQTTELLKLKDGEVSILGSVLKLNGSGVSVADGALTIGEGLRIGDIVVIGKDGIVLGDLLSQKAQHVSIAATGESAKTVTLGGNVILVDNANEGECDLTLELAEGDTLPEGFTCKLIFTNSAGATVNVDAQASGGADGSVSGCACVELVWLGSEDGWQVIGQTPAAP